MKPKLIAVGPSLPPSLIKEYQASHTILHRSLVTLRDLPLKTALIRALQRKKHDVLLLSSPFAAFSSRRLFVERALPLPTTIACVGPGTKRAALQTFYRKLKHTEIVAAEETTQEGLFSLLQTLVAPPSSLMWPSSVKARSHLGLLVREAGFSLDHVPIYYPLPSYRRISWKPEDTIFFSCPSSVEAFFSFYSHSLFLPSMRCIGSITEKALAEKISKRLFTHVTQKITI